MARRTINPTLVKLEQQMAKLQSQADALRKKEVATVIAQAKDAIAHYGITAEELGFGTGAAPRAQRKPGRPAGRGRPARAPKKTPGRKSKGVIKYRDADGHAWTGVGKRPNWFKDALAAGRTAEELLVQS